MLVRLVSHFGSAAVAGYTVAVRVFMLGLLPSWGVANAAATLVGQNLGAGQPDRAARTVWQTGWANAGLMSLIGLVFILGARPVLAALGAPADALEPGVLTLRIFAAGYGFYAFGMVVVSAFNGAGDTMTPTRINVACYWLFQLPLAWALALPMGLGVGGVLWAVPIAEAGLTVAAILLFRRGGWRRMNV